METIGVIKNIQNFESDKSEKILTATLYEETDDYEGIIKSQEIYLGNKLIFNVYNLNESPKDALIGRSLFDAYDYIRVLNKGIELAKQGYTQIKMIVAE